MIVRTLIRLCVHNQLCVKAISSIPILNLSIRLMYLCDIRNWNSNKPNFSALLKSRASFVNKFPASSFNLDSSFIFIYDRLNNNRNLPLQERTLLSFGVLWLVLRYYLEETWRPVFRKWGHLNSWNIAIICMWYKNRVMISKQKFRAVKAKGAKRLSYK